MVRFMAEPAAVNRQLASHLIYNRLGEPSIRVWAYNPAKDGFVLRKDSRYL